MSETETVVHVGGQESEWKPQIVEHSLTVANPYTLLQSAVEKGFDAERISQFMDLQDRMEKRESIRLYTEAMNKCQKRMPIVIRDKVNTGANNAKYATLEAVANIIKPIYTEEGFTLEFGEEDSPLEKHRRIVCYVQHVGGHGRQLHLDSIIDDTGPKGGAVKTPVQGLVSMVTYLRRTLSCMAFNVTVADQDTDGQNVNALLNEEQCSYLRQKLVECETAKNPVREAQFIAWLAEEQKDRDNVQVLEDVQQRFYTKALKALEKKLKEGIARQAELAKGVPQ